MKRVCAILLSVMLLSGASSVSWAISWEHDLTAALEKGKQAKKPVMADFYTEWCGWCKKLDKDVYGDPAIGALAENFVSVKVDCGVDKGAAIRYRVKGFPTIIFFNAAGGIEETVIGYRPPQVFAGTMQKVLGQAPQPVVVQPPPLAAPPVAKERVAGEFELEGIMLPKAIVNGKIVSVGQMVDGAYVVAIAENHVTVRYQGEELELCLFCPAIEAGGDIVYFKNGRSFSGIIVKENAANIALQTDAAGTVMISRADIRKIERASPEALVSIRKRWAGDAAKLPEQMDLSQTERDKRFKGYADWMQEAADRAAAERRASEGGIKVFRDPQSSAILVPVVLNGNEKAVLTLDTGAGVVVLSKRMGKKLGIDTESLVGGDVQDMHLSGGKTVKVRMFVLKGIGMEGVEEKDVQAAVLLEDSGFSGFRDGLLGRSFLGRFSIKVDMKNMVMTLQKIK